MIYFAVLLFFDYVLTHDNPYGDFQIMLHVLVLLACLWIGKKAINKIEEKEND